MCYAIPGQVTNLKGSQATVSYFGEEKKVINELDALAVGDYVYAQGGFVIEKVPVLEAEQTLSAWKEMFFDLQKVDSTLSSVDLTAENIEPKLKKILDRAAQEKVLTKAEMTYLLELREPAQLELFYKTANFLRQKNLGNSCCVHGIIELSNNCQRNCWYCGISVHNQKLKHYRMSRPEILSAVAEAVDKYGFKALVLQSGEDCGYSIAELAEIIAEIKDKHAVLIFISFGELGAAGLKKLYEAGARGLLLRFETANPELYAKLHPGYKLADRLAELKAARELGYLLITGGLIGLPGQTAADIIKDVQLAKELKAEMYSFGPFLPHPETPLADVNKPDEDMIIKTLALARFIDPKEARILVTTGLETINASARKKALLAGANSVMLNITPIKYRKLYAIYPGRAHEDEEINVQIKETIGLLESLGRAPTDLGVS